MISHEIYLKFILKENADGLCEDFRFFHSLLSSPLPLGSFAGSGMRRSQFLSENVNNLEYVRFSKFLWIQQTGKNIIFVDDFYG